MKEFGNENFNAGKYTKGRFTVIAKHTCITCDCIEIFRKSNKKRDLKATIRDVSIK